MHSQASPSLWEALVCARRRSTTSTATVAGENQLHVCVSKTILTVKEVTVITCVRRVCVALRAFYKVEPRSFSSYLHFFFGVRSRIGVGSGPAADGKRCAARAVAGRAVASVNVCQRQDNDSRSRNAMSLRGAAVGMGFEATLHSSYANNLNSVRACLQVLERRAQVLCFYFLSWEE